MQEIISTAIISLTSSILGALIVVISAKIWRKDDHKSERSIKIMEWAIKCSKELSYIEHLMKYELKITKEEKCKLSSEVSSLIEEGRIFFINSEKEKYGDRKFFAYRGYRPLILDFLVSAYNVMESHENENVYYKNMKSHEYIRLIRRGFISSVKKELNKNWGSKSKIYEKESTRGNGQYSFDQTLQKGEDYAAYKFKLD